MHSLTLPSGLARASAGRPSGSYGDVRAALADAWRQGPAPVAVAAERACVAWNVAKYTASRMAADGQLAVHTPGRPAVLMLACDLEDQAPEADPFDELLRAVRRMTDTG
jgi:hypothetical protein